MGSLGRKSIVFVLTSDANLNRDLFRRFEERGHSVLLIDGNEPAIVAQLESKTVDLVVCPIDVLRLSDAPLLCFWNSKPNGMLPVVLISSKMTPQERQNLNAVKGMSLLMTDTTDAEKLQRLINSHLPKKTASAHTPIQKSDKFQAQVQVQVEDDGKPLVDPRDKESIELTNRITHVNTGEVLAAALVEYDGASMTFEVAGGRISVGDDLEVRVSFSLSGATKKILFGSSVLQLEPLDGGKTMIVVGLQNAGDSFAREIAAEIEGRQAEVLSFLKAQR